ILDTLAEYGIKATFFCVGENIERNPDLFARLLAEGHRIGNHTQNHLKGWDTADEVYLDNVARCQQLTKTSLFRPPYARAKKSQLKQLYKNFEVVFWDVISGDFDTAITPEQCYQNVIKYVQNGSIIVFHDNLKAIPRVSYALPKTIDYLLERGYEFDVL